MESTAKKRVIKRNIRFWGRYTEQMILLLVLFACVYGVIFSVMSGEGNILDTGLDYVILCGILFAYISPVSYGTAYMPLALSFGSRRREAVWGMQFMYGLLAVQIMLLFVLYYGAAAGFANVNGLLVAVYAEIIVAGLALGQFASAINLKFGTKGFIWITMLLWLVIIGAASIPVVILTKNTHAGSGFEGTMNPGIVLAIAVVGVVLYVASTAVMFRVMRNYEVRR